MVVGVWRCLYFILAHPTISMTKKFGGSASSGPVLPLHPVVIPEYGQSMETWLHAMADFVSCSIWLPIGVRVGALQFRTRERG